MKCMFKVVGLFVLPVLVMACSSTSKVKTESSVNLVLKSQVDWQHLNPARGDKAPKAGTLWGNRGFNTATGFLLRPKDGFESPPHIHNVTYRGVVINGLIHNDDPDAAYMWMPSGSYWTQPKGESHITAAKGTDSLAYIEIEYGPYLVKPKEQAFDSGERPVNVDKANLVWLNNEQVTWLPKTSSLEVSYLWGETGVNQLNGRFLKVPKGFKGKLVTDSNEFRVVVIQGFLDFYLDGKEQVLEPGSYFSSVGPTEHLITNYDANDVILYIRTRGEFSVVQ